MDETNYLPEEEPTNEMLCPNCRGYGTVIHGTDDMDWYEELCLTCCGTGVVEEVIEWK